MQKSEKNYYMYYVHRDTGTEWHKEHRERFGSQSGLQSISIKTNIT